MASIPQIAHAHPFTDREAVAASNYTVDELAEVYNQARVDYIVPMPMNGKRMNEYIRNYDIDLNASVVVNTPGGEPLGIGMVAFREDRAWITRLGITPASRGKRMGQFVMEVLIAQAATHHCRTVQLEVIVGNDPALQLFEKLGFVEKRRLLVIRRPPGKLEVDETMCAGCEATELYDAQIPYYLEQREPDVAWLEETPSLLNTKSLRGIEVTLADGEKGWLIFQRSPFQLTHFVFSPDPSPQMARALLYQVHSTYPMQDTKVENLPVDHSTWAAFQAFGYFEAFRRIEMTLDLC